MSKRSRLIALLTALFLLSAPAGVAQTQTTDLPPLTNAGPYGVGIKVLDLIDEQRDNWDLTTYVWFPADPEQGKPILSGSPLLMGAVPDLSGAPYPLIIYSHGGGGEYSDLSRVVEQLASQGYVVATPQHHDTNLGIGEFVDRPLDVMLVLNELAAIETGALAGMIDTNNVGLMGWSQGGETAFQMLGLLSDPVHYETWCAEHPELPTVECTWADLEDIAAYRAQWGLQTMSDGTWAPFGDARIHAVLVFDPCDFALTNDDAMAAVTTPTMIVHATHDTACDYENNAVRTYAQLGTEDRFLITLVNRDHMAVYVDQALGKHFATAFFGAYLKNDPLYAPYLTPEGLPTSRFPGLIWGPYEDE